MMSHEGMVKNKHIISELTHSIVVIPLFSKFIHMVATH